MNNTKQKPSEVISEFLNYLDQIKSDYKIAYDIVGAEDKKDQDYKHDMELAPTESEFIKASRRYRRGRRTRRANKDKVLELEEIIRFLDELNHKSTFNKMKQLLGKQRKIEEYLASDRHYNRRGEDD